HDALPILKNMLKSFFISFGTGTAFIRPIGNICTSGTSQKFLPYLQSGCKNPNDSYICLKPLISTAGGRFNFITAQGRHLFKEATFTVSTLPRARRLISRPRKASVLQLR